MPSTNNHGDVNVSFYDALFADGDMDKINQFMLFRWEPISKKIIALYLVFFVYLGQKVMTRFRPLNGPVMYRLLAAWNFGISLFSFIMLYYLVPEIIHTLNEHTFHDSLCYNYGMYENAIYGYWLWIWVMTKFLELGDTAFLVLMKKPLILLHYFHHSYAFWYATNIYVKKQAWSRWSVCSNLLVHTVMYFYFGLRALKVKMPRRVSMFITTTQLLQFFLMCYIFARLLIIKTFGVLPDCEASFESLIFGTLMYYSFLYLFSKLFYDSYIQKRESNQDTIKKE